MQQMPCLSRSAVQTVPCAPCHCCTKQQCTCERRMAACVLGRGNNHKRSTATPLVRCTVSSPCAERRQPVTGASPHERGGGIPQGGTPQQAQHRRAARRGAAAIEIPFCAWRPPAH